MSNKAAYNAIIKEPIRFRGVDYIGTTKLFNSMSLQPAVSVGTFTARLRKRLETKQKLDETDIHECLYSSTEDYKRLHGVRKTYIKLDGKRLDLADLYMRITKSTVVYHLFRQRIRSLEKRRELNREILRQAATFDVENWHREYGGGRRKPFFYEGDLYEYAHGEYPSFTAFLKRIGRYDDREYLKHRKKNGWDIDTALEEPSIPLTERLGKIYKIVQASTGLVYIGLTIMSLKVRWESHLRTARNSRRLSPLHKAMHEAEEEDFTVEVIETKIEISSLAERERHWISVFGCVQPKGLNANRGGALSGGRGKSVIVDGVKYPSLVEAAHQLSPVLELPEHVIITRLAKGKELPETVRSHSKHPAAGSSHWRRWKSLLNAVDKDVRDGPIHECWRDYDIWSKDVLPSYIKGLELVRKDDTRPWGSRNFEWVTTQKKIERVHGCGLTIFGVCYPSKKAISKKFGIPVPTLNYRMNENGMTPEEAVTAKIGPTSRRTSAFVFEGEEFSSQTQAGKILADRHGITFHQARDRVRRGIPTTRWKDM